MVAAAGLADAMVALHSGMTSRFSDPVDRLFHDEEFDGPAPSAMRVLALALAAEREVVTARVAGCGDVDVVGAEDIGDTGNRRDHRAGGTDRATTGGAIRSVGDGGGLSQLGGDNR